MGIIGFFSPVKCWISRLFWLEPGTIAGPFLPPFNMPPRVSRLNPPCGASSPWHCAQRP